MNVFNIKLTHLKDSFDINNQKCKVFGLGPSQNNMFSGPNTESISGLNQLLGTLLV